MINVLYSISLLVGLLLIGAGTFDATLTSLPSNAAARVNDTIITQQQLAAAVLRVYKGEDSTAFNRHSTALLPRIIQQELLLQRAEEVGLFASDPVIRKAIINAVMDDATVADGMVDPNDGQLRQYYQENLHLYETPARLQLQQVFFRHSDDDSKDKDRVLQAITLLKQGVSFDHVREQLGDAEIISLPTGLTPIPYLARLLPQEIVTRVQNAEVNTITEPLPTDRGTHILRINARSEAQPKPFAQVAHTVAAHYQQHRQISNLNDRLKTLWHRADIKFASDAPTRY